MSSRVKFISMIPIVAMIMAVMIGSSACNAQGIPISVGGLDLSSSNDYPTPGQNITVTARSYSIDINAAKLTWSVNGKTVQQGVGLTTYSVTAPSLGKDLNISVAAAAPDGAVIANQITISPGSVDMILESDGYMPPFFKGKLPVAYQNTIKVVAVPHPFAINVKVSSRDGISTTEGTISITPGSPSLSFYSNDSLYGPLYNKAVKDGVSIGSQKETSILATPYGFNKPANSIGSLQFQWTINNNYSPDLDNIDSIVLRAPDNTSGSSDIALKIQNTKEFLQQANASFLADFNSTQNPQTSTQVTF